MVYSDHRPSFQNHPSSTLDGVNDYGLLGAKDTVHVTIEHRLTNLLFFFGFLVLFSFCSLLFYINCVFYTKQEPNYSPLDEMLVHRRVIPRIEFAGTH